MIFTGVFDRFPELHVSWIEIGVGWLPHFIEMLDDKFWRNRSWGELPIGEPPSFYWRRNNSATFITDRSGIELRERVGVNTIMWSSDYPHHGNDWPYSRKVIEDTMGNIPADERDRMIGGNAVPIFHLDGRHHQLHRPGRESRRHLWRVRGLASGARWHPDVAVQPDRHRWARHDVGDVLGWHLGHERAGRQPARGQRLQVVHRHECGCQ